MHAKSERMLPGHILTGPIAVKGAEPGDVLEVDILDVQLRQDWGYNVIRPLAGTLPDDFHETRLLQHPARPGADGRPHALGARSAARAVLRRDGRGAAAGLGPHHLARPARDGRQSRQQGTRRRRQALSAGVRAGRAVLLRRRPWRAGRRRGLRHRDRDRAAGPLPADAAQGSPGSTIPAPRRRRIT